MIELMVVIAVAVVLMFIAVPNFNTMLTQNRLTGATNEMLAVTTVARSIALTEGFNVVACPTGDGVNCDNAQSWGAGWMAFVDCNNNNTLDTGTTICDGQSERMLREGAAESGASLEVAGNQFLVYQPSGRVLAPRNFDVCASGLANGKRIQVSATGRARVVGNAGAC